MNKEVRKPDIYPFDIPENYVEIIRKDYAEYRWEKDDFFPQTLQYLIEEILLKQCEFVNIKAAMDQAAFDEEQFESIIKASNEARSVLQRVFATELGVSKKQTLLFEDSRKLYGLAKSLHECIDKILSNEEDGLSCLNWILENYQYVSYILDITKEKIYGALAAEIDFVLEDFCNMMDDFARMEVDRIITYFFGEKLH